MEEQQWNDTVYQDLQRLNRDKADSCLAIF